MTLTGRHTSIPAAGFSLAVLVAASGCAVRPRAIPAVALPPLREASLAEVLDAHDRTVQAMQSFSASGRLALRDLRAGRERDFGVRVVAGRGGRLYLKASVAVVTAVEAVSDGSRFWVQVPSKRTVWTGAADGARFEAGGESFEALRPADLVAALLPEPLAPAAGDTLLLEGDREAFSLALGRTGPDGQGLVRRRVWVDRQTLRPARSRSYDERGTVALEAVFADWRDGLPRRVAVLRPNDGYEARFVFDRVQANVSLPARLFEPRTPAEYEVVRVDDARP